MQAYSVCKSSPHPTELGQGVDVRHDSRAPNALLWLLEGFGNLI